jgi:hypothetical protein
MKRAILLTRISSCSPVSDFIVKPSSAQCLPFLIILIRVAENYDSETSAIEGVLFAPTADPLTKMCIVKDCSFIKGHKHDPEVRISSSSKSNLKEHAKSWHSRLFKKVLTLHSEGASDSTLRQVLDEHNNAIVASEGSLPALVRKMQKLAPNVVRARVLFALHSIKYGHSFSSSQDFILDAFFESFQKDRGLILGNREQFSRLSIALCVYTLKRIYDKASQDGMTFFSITIDGWKSSTRDCYIGLTFHYVSTKFDLVSKPLEIMNFEDSQTGVNLAEHVRSRCAFHFPKATLFGVTCDGGANFQRGAVEVVGERRRMWCIAHIGNLAVHDICRHEAIASALDSIKKIKATLSSNQTISNAFEKECHHQYQVKGFIDFPDTRWVYVSEVFARAELLWNIVKTFKRTHALPALDDLISKSLFSRIRVVSSCLRVISEFITTVQTQTAFILPRIPQLIQDVANELRALEEDEDDETLSGIISFIRSTFEDRFEHIFSTYTPIALACLLNPTTMEMPYFSNNVREAARGELNHLVQTYGRVSVIGARDILAVFFEDMARWLTSHSDHDNPIQGFWSSIDSDGMLILMKS